MIAALSVITSGIVAWSLWTRRHTWRVKWETASTVNVALMAVAGFLGTPSVGAVIGYWLHHVTHLWNLQFYIGHLCFLGSMCAITYNAAAKLMTDEEFKTWFRNRIQIPTAVGALIITALFTGSRSSKIPYDSLGLMKAPGAYMEAYWVSYCLLLSYLLYHGIRAFIDLWYDEPSRSITNIYLAASLFSVATLILRLATALEDRWESAVVMDIMSVTGTFAISLFTIGAAYSWISRVRWFTNRPGWTGITTPHFRPRHSHGADAEKS